MALNESFHTQTDQESDMESTFKSVPTYETLLNSYTDEPFIEYSDIKEYRLLESIGSGSFGQVWLAIRKIDDKLVAIKFINADPYNLGYDQTVLSDVIYPLLLDHPHIVKYKSIIGPDFTSHLDLPTKDISVASSSQVQSNFENNPTLQSSSDSYDQKIFSTKGFNFETFIGGVMEVAEQDLKSLIKSSYKSSYKYELSIDLLNMMYQLIDALVYLDSFNIIHGDIKPANILTKPCPKLGHNLFLADFGLASNRSCYKEKLSNMVYTLWYRPPEITLTQVTSNNKIALYDSKADVWALGCTLYEIIMKQPLFMIRGTEMEPRDQLLVMIFNFFGPPIEQKLQSETENNKLLHISELYNEWVTQKGQRFLNLHLKSTKDPLDAVPNPYQNILRRMLEVDPKERASALELRDDPLFSSLPIGSFKSDRCYRYEDSLNLNCIERDRFFRRSFSFDSKVSRLIYKDKISTINGDIYYSELIEWMIAKITSDQYNVELIDDLSYRQPYDIICCAIQLLFRYIDREIYIDKMNIRLLTATALSLAHNFISPYPNRLSVYGEDLFNESELKRTQRRMMRLLNFDITARTPFDSIQSYSQRIDSNVLRLAGNILLHIACTDYYLNNDRYMYRHNLPINCLALVHIALYGQPPTSFEVIDYKSIELIINIIDLTIADREYLPNTIGLYLDSNYWTMIIDQYRKFIIDKNLNIRGLILSTDDLTDYHDSKLITIDSNHNYYRRITKHFTGISFINYRLPNIYYYDSSHRSNLVETDSSHSSNLVETDSSHRSNLVETDSSHRSNLVDNTSLENIKENNDINYSLINKTIEELKDNKYRVVVVTNCQQTCLDLIGIGIRLLSEGRYLYTDSLPREAIKNAIFNGDYNSRELTSLIKTRNKINEEIHSLRNSQVDLNRESLTERNEINYNKIVDESTTKSKILQNINNEIYHISRILIEEAMIKFEKQDNELINIVASYADKYAHKLGYQPSNYMQLTNDRRYLILKAKTDINQRFIPSR